MIEQLRKMCPFGSRLYANAADESKSINSALTAVDFEDFAFGLEILSGTPTLVEAKDGDGNLIYLEYDIAQKIIPIQVTSLKIPAGSNAIIRVYIYKP